MIVNNLGLSKCFWILFLFFNMKLVDCFTQEPIKPTLLSLVSVLVLPM